MFFRRMWVFFVVAVAVAAGKVPKFECSISEDLKNEIKSYAPIVDQILSAAVNGSYSGVIYNDLTDYLDEFGHRHQGTAQLELAIDNALERQSKAGLVVSVHDVLVPSWTRGEESAGILTPRRQKIAMLGLGYASNTSIEGITAPVIVVKDYDELDQRKAEVPGKIVLFNAKYVSYGETVTYRTNGPNRASKLGAVAALVRSITDFSLNTPHTGTTEFDEPSLRIPAAAITLEDADLIARLAAKGKEVTVNLKMSATNNPPVISRNAIGDIVGASKPDEYVVISGHIDSWDVGQGAMDDGGGSFVAWHSLALIKKLGLKTPARTLRSILWTAEEGGLVGSKAYRSDREEEIKKWVAAFESDGGIFNALGIGFSGNDEASCIMQEITSLFKSINGDILNRQPSAGSDIQEFSDLNIPLGEPFIPNNNYFYYHHTQADYINSLTSEDLDQNLAIFASAIYILADLSVRLPRDEVAIQEAIVREHIAVEPFAAGSSGSVLPTMFIMTTIFSLLFRY